MSSLYHPVRIGSLQLDGNLFLAPVAGYSDRAFRGLCIKGGSNFEYTEMVSAEALTRRNGKTQEIMKAAPNESKYAVQIFGGTPEVMYEAACLVLEQTQASCIDINAGCPVPKVVKTGAGSSLTRDPERLHDIVAAVVQAVKDKNATLPASDIAQPDATLPCAAQSDGAHLTDSATVNNAISASATRSSDSATGARLIPVTVKIRSGWDQLNITFRDAAERAIAAGAAALTMHPRTRAQGYEGRSDWALLRELVEIVDSRVPVFGSGDIFKPEDAKKMLEETKVDGVMFARGAMGHPFIFRQTRELLLTGSYSDIAPKERLTAGFEELDVLIEDRGEKAACKDMRKRFCAYSKGLNGGAALRLAIVHAETKSDYQNIFAEYL
ncbi:tRNA-dihydrouridine synthase [Treponema sp.]|uniref:tRNA-dihydrouridine synthase n=1 Tax=Treponema sp. TaxID=166 RepID=UPI00298D78AC|nr:tRNA-dihydrouridine synthase [Treponema sp.]MCR5612764.1 tRNA-dihydrouridine synthase [Treponema sp.]